MNKSSPLQTDVIIVIVGIGGIAVAALRLLNPIAYPAADPRSQQSVELLISGFGAAFSLFFLVVGLVRLYMRSRRG